MSSLVSEKYHKKESDKEWKKFLRFLPRVVDFKNYTTSYEKIHKILKTRNWIGHYYLEINISLDLNKNECFPEIDIRIVAERLDRKTFQPLKQRNSPKINGRTTAAILGELKFRSSLAMFLLDEVGVYKDTCFLQTLNTIADYFVKNSLMTKDKKIEFLRTNPRWIDDCIQDGTSCMLGEYFLESEYGKLYHWSLGTRFEILESE